MPFDFDAAMEKADCKVFDCIGTPVTIGDSEAVQAIIEHIPNEFDAMAGTITEMSVLAVDAPPMEKHMTVTNLKTGQVYKISSNPKRRDSMMVATL